MASVNPYLNFEGNCEEAFNFYKSIFGGEFQTIMRFKDAPPNSMPNDGSDGEWLLHVALPIGKGGSILMGSDRPKSYPGAKGDVFSVSVSADSEAEARKIFEGLSTGGKITMPFDKTFWGSLFGMSTDKYGIQWMVGYSLPQTQS